MTYVYKRLPAGGYTALPVTSDADLKAKLAQGWSVDPPADAPIVPPAPAETTVEPSEDDTPVRRGRKPRVN